MHWRAGNPSVNQCSVPVFMWASSMDWVRHPLDCQWASRKVVSKGAFLTFPHPFRWPVPPFHPTLTFLLTVSQDPLVPHVPALPTSHRFTTFFCSPHIQICFLALSPRLVLYSLFIGGLVGCWQEMRACPLCPPFSCYHHKLYSLVLLLVPAASHTHHPIHQSQPPWTHIVRVNPNHGAWNFVRNQFITPTSVTSSCVFRSLNSGCHTKYSFLPLLGHKFQTTFDFMV